MKDKKQKSITTKMMINRLRGEVNDAGSQRELADRWGIDYQHISNTLRGVKLPTKIILAKLNLISDRTIHYRYYEGIK
jgi:hypothetical protein